MLRKGQIPILGLLSGTSALIVALSSYIFIDKTTTLKNEIASNQQEVSQLKDKVTQSEIDNASMKVKIENIEKNTDKIVKALNLK